MDAPTAPKLYSTFADRNLNPLLRRGTKALLCKSWDRQRNPKFAVFVRDVTHMLAIAMAKLTYYDGPNKQIPHSVRFIPLNPATFFADKTQMRPVRVKLGPLPKPPDQVVWRIWKHHPSVIGFFEPQMRYETGVFIEMLLHPDEATKYDQDFNFDWAPGFHVLPTFTREPLPPSIPWTNFHGTPRIAAFVPCKSDSCSKCGGAHPYRLHRQFGPPLEPDGKTIQVQASTLLEGPAAASPFQPKVPTSNKEELRWRQLRSFTQNWHQDQLHLRNLRTGGVTKKLQDKTRSSSLNRCDSGSWWTLRICHSVREPRHPMMHPLMTEWTEKSKRNLDH